MYTKQAELKAGLVVLAALVGTLALLYFAGGSEPIWGSYRYVHLRFEPGFIAPEEGDEVLMNGAEVGSVSEVLQAEEIHRGAQLNATVRARLGVSDPTVTAARELYILAVLKLPADQIIPAGTRAQIEQSFTGTRTLQLLPGHSLENLSDAQIRDNPLPAFAAPGLASISEKLQEIAEKVEVLVEGGTDLIADARGVVAILRDKIAGIDLRQMNEDATAGVAALRRTLENVEQRMGPIAEKVESAATNIDKMTSTGAEAVTEIKGDMGEILGTLKGVAERLDRIMADAEPKISGFLSDMQVVGKNVVKLSKELQGIGPEARAILSELGVDAGILMKTLKDTGRNLLDASEDLRAHPWKLLNEPSQDQIAFENLRSATLNYERAMRELNESSRRLTQLLVNPPEDDADAKAAIGRALQTFEAQLKSVRTTERRFLELLNQQRPAAGGRRNR